MVKTRLYSGTLRSAAEAGLRTRRTSMVDPEVQVGVVGGTTEESGEQDFWAKVIRAEAVLPARQVLHMGPVVEVVLPLQVAMGIRLGVGWEVMVLHLQSPACLSHMLAAGAVVMNRALLPRVV